MSARNFFTEEQQKEIIAAIVEAEKASSGEIRVHLDDYCKVDPLDRAAYLFAKLEMHKTQLRNGVLLYVALQDRKLAIIGDAGINAVVPQGFWDEVKDTIVGYFKQNNFKDGICEGIKMAGDKLKAYFPFEKNDINELPNEISF